MKKILVFLIGMLLVSCHDSVTEIDTFGYAESIFETKFNPNQDWRTTTSSSIYSDRTVQILVADTSDNSLRLLNEGNREIYFDVPNNYYALFASDGQGHYKKFNLGDKKISFDNLLITRADNPEYKSFLTGTVETFANQRGWLPGEVFYIYNPVMTVTSGYDDDFKTTFRSIIFNYFPNGKKYNNLPKIKKSGYYNESAYPITTGEKPIIVSPVYKNDGGYKEIAFAELYYYYFKGDLSVAEIEALPKYRAIDLSEVYENNNNNNIKKANAYALAYFGDGIPTIGTTGTYQFPEDYKIGFCYKSNTETDNKKKQGELYGDGRLNYNINSWGNFKSSNLAPSDPRMGWVSINNKSFLCIESGTDADINDLILEIEGGVEVEDIMPIEIEQQFYTFCFEDNKLGDYDMNDVVLKGTRIDETHVEYTLMACGAMDHLYIYNIEGEHIKSSIEVHDLFNKQNQFINTTKGDNTPYITDVIVVDKNFSFLNELTQPYIFDKDKSWIIKISRKGEDPHAIMIPYDFKWPLETICIKDAYLKFNEWGQGLVTDTDWYKYPIEGRYYE